MTNAHVYETIAKYAQQSKKEFRKLLAKECQLSNLHPDTIEVVCDALLNVPEEFRMELFNLARQSQGALRSLDQWC